MRKQSATDHWLDFRGFSYKNRYACFNCCKAFKEYEKNEGIGACPNCGGEISKMNVWWKVPKQSNKKGWQLSRKFIV